MKFQLLPLNLAIEWNDIDPKLILLTAFYQDWTYDVFLYNGNRKNLAQFQLKIHFLNG